MDEVRDGQLAIAELEPKLTRTLVLARPIDREPTAAVNAVEREIRRVILSIAADLHWTPLI